jgi:DNA repair exonuclease SbcCD nuclease subunit
MKFAHFADIHLGFEQYNQSWRAEDFLRAFREGIKRVIKEGVDFVIIAGDMFHRSIPNPKTIKDAIDLLTELRERNIPVFAIEGNHDKSVREVSIYHLLESLELMHVLGIRRKRIETDYTTSTRLEEGVYLVKGVFGDVEIVGDRHRTSWQLEKILPFLKPEGDESVLVLHQSVKEVVDIELNLAYELTLNDLPPASYYAFGHIHIPRVYDFNGRFIVYPGCIERYDIREASHIINYEVGDVPTVREGLRKGFYIVEDFKPRFVEIRVRNLYNVNIAAETREEIETKLNEVLETMSKEDMLIGKIKCSESVDIKRLTDSVLKRVKYAEIKCEVVKKEVEKVELKREDEFFSEFELKLLEFLKEDDDMLRGSDIEMIKTYFGLLPQKSERRAEVQRDEPETPPEILKEKEEKREEKKRDTRKVADQKHLEELRKSERNIVKKKGLTLLDFMEER